MLVRNRKIYKIAIWVIIGSLFSFLIYKATEQFYYGHENNDGFTTFAYWIMGYTLYIFLLKQIGNVNLFDNIVVKSILIMVLSIYMFDYIYLLSGLSQYPYGRGAFISIPLFLGAIVISGFLLISIVIDSRVSTHIIYFFLIMLGSFGFFMFHEKQKYDIRQKIEYEQREAEIKAEKLENEAKKLEKERIEKSKRLEAKRKIEANKKAEKVFDRLWTHENNLSLIVEKLDDIGYETEQIKEKKALLVLILYVKDEKYRSFFEINRPISAYSIHTITSKILKDYELTEDEYLKLFSIIRSYNKKFNSQTTFAYFVQYNKEGKTLFRKLNRKNYTKASFVVLKEFDIDLFNTFDLISDAEFISDAQAKDKAISFILEKMTIETEYSWMESIKRLVIKLQAQEEADKYMKILEKKLKNLKFNESQLRCHYRGNKMNFIELYHHLGKNHFLIKAIPQKIKEFYLRSDIVGECKSVQKDIEDFTVVF